MIIKKIHFLLLLLCYITVCEGQPTLKPLTEGGEPSFDPSGTKIVYVYRGKIWTVDTSGKHKSPIGDQSFKATPRWSPDGRRIVFSSYGQNVPRRDKFELWIMNTNGTSAHRLIEPTLDEYSGDQFPMYSSDGKYIVWTRLKQLWIMDSIGNNPRPLTKEPAKEYEVAGDWSPDGKYIAYLRSDNPYDTSWSRAIIWLIRPDGEEQKVFLNGIRANWVKWSRDGNFLYYSDRSALWKISIDGDTPAKKIFDSYLEQGLGHFDISVDEQWITYEDTDKELIYLVCLDDSSKSRQRGE
jgi:Tol biopolymer transport system component